ncbi:unnamed protein product (macronuclear) [Paramecium tetraurelia]|uniref:Deoxyhypusine synthase n=1 Tax=Paramecium tetraurelia TaxID=5888 RepID=A0CD09_PARTE|nr:uncharacterized protein GSPATT00037461001 [Paramecium tetraurelia]CAK68676.1 unnamed protein product [Paramecium tetraurelia]|eukprot:XP_001436073.1 hypothetical protein (macronuclear) [Paramecium tetraurelia strain d4-2]
MKQAEEQYQTLYKLQPEPLTTPEIKGYDFNQGVDFDALLNSYANFGLQATQLNKAIDIINKMIHWRLGPNEENQDPNTRCTIFLGYTSNMVSSGNREIIRYLAQHKMIDAIVTTAGAIEEDLMKCLSTFHKGDWQANDKEIRLKAICRIGNIYVPAANYGKLEDWLLPVFQEMYKEQKEKSFIWSPSSMIKRFGERINDERSIYYWCAKNDIPVYCPALTDGAIGDMMFHFNYKQDGLICDILQDVVKLNKKAMYSKKSGLVILGGGVVKHHIMNANIWRNGADLAVFINTGIEYDGSDAGAKPSEGITWGKLRVDAEYVKVFSEATLVFPLVVAQTFAKHFQEAKRV